MPDWMKHGICSQTDPELFFPEQGSNDRGRAAKSVCAKCPVRVPCGRYAILRPDLLGIWGGLTAAERDRIRKYRGRKAA